MNAMFVSVQRMFLSFFQRNQKFLPLPLAISIMPSDLSSIRRLVKLAKGHAEEHPVQPTFEVVSADDFIVRTAVNSGKYGRLRYEDHDLRTFKGQMSFGSACEKKLLETLYLLDENDKEKMFKREDFEPEMTMLGILRKMQGIF